ncbi:hypothetical protein [Anaerovorax odorimutans]|uniref:hypothetical protein n=1 Tax=Anaerovorax odorimutans TaxID=109327 RepID=UPI000416EE99|nr:hypothetical protein [Anaerovorax odorimutans]
MTVIYKGSYTGAQIDSKLGSMATDSEVVHLAGTEEITGDKTFTGVVEVNTPAADTQAANKSYVDTEVINRQNADADLQGQITAEISNRGQADTNLQTQITTNAENINTLNTDLTTEATTRETADTDLQTQITTNAADIADRYTKTQSNLRYSNAIIKQSSGEILNLSTAESTFPKLDILGNTVVTPADPEQDISPDNPATIESVGESGSFSVKSSGKNLMSYPYSTTTKAVKGITITDNGDGSITINGTATGYVYFYFVSNTVDSIRRISKGTYTISMKGLGENLPLLFTIYDEFNGNVLFKETISSTYPISTFAIEQDGYYTLLLTVVTGATIDNVIIYPQLEIGDTATEYSPYAGADYTLELKDTEGSTLEPLRNIKDGDTVVAEDRIFKDADGSWKVERNTGKVVFDGIENWLLYPSENTDTVRFVTLISYAKPNLSSVDAPLLCDYFMTENGYSTNTECCFIDKRLISIYINKSRLATEDRIGFKEWLQSNPITVVYQLGEPTITTLHADTQTVLNSLKQTYLGTTVVYGTDLIIPSFDVEYVADINKVISDLTQAVIALGGTI